MREVYRNGTRNDKYRAISTCPPEYAVAQIQKIFPGASNTLIKKAKKLQAEQGNLKFRLNFILIGNKISEFKVLSPNIVSL